MKTEQEKQGEIAVGFYRLGQRIKSQSGRAQMIRFIMSQSQYYSLTILEGLTLDRLQGLCEIYSKR